jgi:conjugative transfer signal peptidase TraF
MRRAMVLLSMDIGLVALCAPFWIQIPAQIVYNPSDSVPRGWYRIGKAEVLHVGDIVLARLPAVSATLASQRGYLPAGVPILKRIGALAPQSVCTNDRVVRIDGDAVATVRIRDGQQRELPVWSQCRSLTSGELFLLSTNPASFDSRYFGPITAKAVIGSAKPLWTWSTL